MGDPEGHAATRVLVVDDDPSIRQVCRINLELDGYEVLEADSLATTRVTLAEDDVDIVVLDVHLGIERSDPLVAECHERRPVVPVVLLTGSVDIAHPAAREADAVLPKPFEIGELVSTVRKLVQVHAHR
jgi:two-component system KDP operon response regulator KdpE